MLKVIVVDDEERICQLIIRLIDWEILGMEVVGVAHNGIEAIDLINTCNPDLAITDIRMPGYDGLDMIARAKDINHNLEFIIISGYGEFEYAQRAVKYGVSDYLLKPIKKDELTQTLIKVKESIRHKKDQLSLEEEYELILKNNIGKRRESLFSDFLISNNNSDQHYTIKEINHHYNFGFQAGYIQILAIKIDTNSKDYTNNQIIIEEKVTNIVTDIFKDMLYELEITFKENICYAMINYSLGYKEKIYKNFNPLLKELMKQNIILREVEITIGVGKAVKLIQDLHQSLETAIWAIEDRIIQGTGNVIEYENIAKSNILDSDILYKFNQGFLGAIERLDEEEMVMRLKSLKMNIKKDTQVNGHDILHITREICNLYILAIRKNHLPAQEGYALLEGFNNGINKCNSIDQVFNYLSKVIMTSLEKIKDEKATIEGRPIRLAKKHIERNYMKNITLDEIGEIIGFNPAYFSSLFKKETGISFTQYISHIRMKHAKELLEESDLRVADICEMVGYSDVKYFTKLFTKHVGLKPNEYRKLYA